MKKKLIIGSVALAIIAIAIIFYSQPKDIVKNADKFYVYRVVYKGEDVTGRVDLTALAKVVSKYKCSRLPHAFAPVQSSQEEVELDCYDENRPMYHILLGEINVAYESADDGGYTIENSQALLTEIINIIQ